MEDAANGLHAQVVKSMVGSVLQHVERKVKSLRCDVSGTAPENVAAYEAGYRAAKRAVLEALGDVE